MNENEHQLTLKKIYVFWVPLAATWLMMSAEGPFLAAVIARLAQPKYNLAAYGVAFSFALLIEAPIIMIMSASTALVRDKDSYLKLRNFTSGLNGIITLIMLIILLPPIFSFITEDLINLPQNVAALTHIACIILIPWPGVIGYRRFYQGILIRNNRTRYVAYGTVLRLTSMAVTALSFYSFLEVEGVVVGASALSVGVTTEAIATRLMAHNVIKDIWSHEIQERSQAEPISYKFIGQFYFPLAMTSILALGAQPIVTFFMGQSRLAIESLAVFPVINSLVFIFRSMGLSFQEVAITWMGDNYEGLYPLRKFGMILGSSVIFLLALVAFTPISNFWFHSVSGLSLELSEFAKFPTQILAIIPGLSVLLSFQRGLLVNARKTAPITIATSIEVIGVIAILILTIHFLNLIGVIAAAIALTIGRMGANTYLVFPYLKILKKTTVSHVY